jgi:hypothetical protein
MSERVLQGANAYRYSQKSGLLDRGKDLEVHWQNGKRFHDFNREAQGNIVRDFYVALKASEDVNGWGPFIQELRMAAPNPI